MGRLNLNQKNGNYQFCKFKGMDIKGKITGGIIGKNLRI